MNLSSKDGGLPFRQMVTTGNEIGISTLDFMDYFIRDPHTEIIGAYLEGAKDAWRLPEIGQKALAAGKPILMWKVGNTEQGQRAAASHTANLGGAMSLYRAAFAQTGIIQVDDIQDVVVSADPFTAKPFEYRVTGDTVRLTGPGAGGVDDRMIYELKLQSNRKDGK